MDIPDRCTSWPNTALCRYNSRMSGHEPLQRLCRSIMSHAGLVPWVVALQTPWPESFCTECPLCLRPKKKLLRLLGAPATSTLRLRLTTISPTKHLASGASCHLVNRPLTTTCGSTNVFLLAAYSTFGLTMTHGLCLHLSPTYALRRSWHICWIELQGPTLSAISWLCASGASMASRTYTISYAQGAQLLKKRYEYS